MADRNAALSLDEGLVEQARSLNLDVAKAAEEGIARAVKSERERRWKIENAEAIAAETPTSKSTACLWQNTGHFDGAFSVQLSRTGFSGYTNV